MRSPEATGLSMLERILHDPLIRRRSARLGHLPFGRCSIRLARESRDFDRAFRLVHVAYAYLGIDGLERDLRMTQQHVLPEAAVLVAMEGEHLVGTITVTLDSPAGLPLDADYPGEIEALRLAGARIAEIGSFAVVQRCRGNGVAQMLALAAHRLSYGLLDASHVVIGVHPKSAAFHRAVWGFGHLGDPRGHAGLNAPVVGMVHDRDTHLRHLERCYPRALSSGLPCHLHVRGDAPLPSTDLCDVHVQERKLPPKMRREVFRELFLIRSRHLMEIGDETRDYLRTQRTDETLTIPTAKGAHLYVAAG